MRAVRTFETAPRLNATGFNADERAIFEIVVGVLVVLPPKGCNARRVGTLIRSTERCHPANLHPSELGPVVRVVIDEQGDARVFVDILAPSEFVWRDALWLFVNRRYDVIVNESEANGHDVRTSLGIGRGQTTDLCGLDVLAFLFLPHGRYKG